MIALSELALTQSLGANIKFAQLGVNLRLAVNIPVTALVKVAVPDIVRTYRRSSKNGPA